VLKNQAMEIKTIQLEGGEGLRVLKRGKTYLVKYL